MTSTTTTLSSNQMRYFKSARLLLFIIWAITLTVASDNPARAIDIVLEPDGILDIADIKYEIIWSDANLVGHTISLFYDTDNFGHDGSLIVQDIPTQDSTNNYFWNTANIPNGDYYIYAAYHDGTSTIYHYSTGPVTIAHITACLDISSRPNLLPNGSFEQGSSKPLDWAINTPDSATRERSWEYAWVEQASQIHSGQRAVKIANTFNGVNTSSAWQDRVTVNSPLIDLPTINGKYLLTAWIKTQNIDIGQVIFRVKYYDQNGNQLEIHSHDDDTFYTGGPHTTEWTQVSFIINPPHWDSPPYSNNAHAEKVNVNFSLDNSAGSLWVDDIALIAINEAEYELYNPGNNYAKPEIVTMNNSVILPSKTGWGSSIQQDPATGVWWIVGPDQKAFWGVSAGANASNSKLQDITGLSNSEYKQQAQYRSNYDLNFNLEWRKKVGANSYSKEQNDIYSLSFSSQAVISAQPAQWVLKDRDNNFMGSSNHYFPDVFSPVWQEHAVDEAEKLLENNARILKNEETIGYWTDNELDYGDLYDFFWGETAKLAFVDWLQGHNDLPSVDTYFTTAGSNINLDIPTGFEKTLPYPTPAELNKAWSSDYHTYTYNRFTDVYGLDKPYIRAHDDPVISDMHAFERVIYKIYVDTIIDNIRRVESDYIESTGQGFHHIIFSNRFHIKTPAGMNSMRRNMDIFNRFDAIAVNLYPKYNQTGAYHPRDLLQIVEDTFYKTTNRPLYVAEFGVAGEDADDFSTIPHLYVARWRPKTVQYQYQRGWAYNNLISTWANLPYMIGATWFKWPNSYGSPEGSDPRNSGIVDDYDNYYTHLTDNMRSTNKRIQAIHRSGDFSLNDINWASAEINLCNGSNQEPPVTPDPTATATDIVTPTLTITPTPTSVVTPTITITPEPTSIPNPIPTDIVTPTSTITPTAITTPTMTMTPEPTGTLTPTATITPIVPDEVIPTPTPTAMVTKTVEAMPVPTVEGGSIHIFFLPIIMVNSK